MLARDHVGDVEELKGSTLRLMQRTYKTNYLLMQHTLGSPDPV